MIQLKLATCFCVPILICSLAGSAISQNKDLDSLWNAGKNTSGSELVELRYDYTIEAYRQREFRKLIKGAKFLRNAANASPDQKYKALGFISFGYFWTGQQDSSEIFEREALETDISGLSPDAVLFVWRTIMASQGRANRGADYTATIDRMVQYATEVKDTTELQDLYLIRGSYLASIGRFSESRKDMESARQLILLKQDSVALGKMYFKMLIPYFNNADYEKALEYALKSDAILKKTGPLYEYGQLTASIGSIYFKLKKFEESIKYYRSGLGHFSSAKDSVLMVPCLNGIAIALSRLNELDSSEYYHKKAISIAERFNATHYLNESYNNIANVYSERGEFNKAIEFFEKSLDLKKILGDYPGMITTYTNLGGVRVYLGQYDLAEKNFADGLSLIDSNTDRDILSALYMEISGLEEAKGNYRMALQWNKKGEALEDSIWNAENQEVIENMRVRYETAEKEALISEQDKLLTVKELESEKQQAEFNFLLLIASALSLLLLAFGWFIFLVRRSKLKIEKQHAQIVLQRTELQEINATKDKLFAIIAHDLRSPVTAFHGISRLIGHYLKSGKQDRLDGLIKDIETSVGNLNHLLDNLLNWALSQSNGIRAVPVTLSVRKEIDHALSHVKAAASAKDIHLNFDSNTEFAVLADKDMFHAIFRNLLNNAIKFTPVSGTIAIVVAKTNGTVLFRVTNEAPNADNQQVSAFFNLQTGKSTSGTAGEKGTGLGLVLCREMVLKQGGTIQAEYTDGKVTVTFSLPAPSLLQDVEPSHEAFLVTPSEGK